VLRHSWNNFRSSEGSHAQNPAFSGTSAILPAPETSPESRQQWKKFIRNHSEEVKQS